MVTDLSKKMPQALLLLGKSYNWGSREFSGWIGSYMRQTWFLVDVASGSWWRGYVTQWEGRSRRGWRSCGVGLRNCLKVSLSGWVQWGAEKTLTLCKYCLGVPYHEKFKVRLDVALSNLNMLKVSWSSQGCWTGRLLKALPNPKVFYHCIPGGKLTWDCFTKVFYCIW